jgi:hypothetical protein
MFTFIKLVFKFLELWMMLATGTKVADDALTSVETLKEDIEKLLEEMNG